MESYGENEIILSEKEKPFWQRIIAALLYTAMIYVMYLVFHYLSIRWIAVGLKYFELVLVLFIGALRFSLTTTICLNLSSQKLKTVYSVGPISIKDNSELPKLEYVSIFKNSMEEFEVNLWHSKNKHYKICIFENFEEAINFGKYFALRLKIDLLDATEKGNSKWLDI
jgi:hypothetical protein